jgi:3-methyl-2-oxobutanoate hydroxymethyltransferase
MKIHSRISVAELLAEKAKGTGAGKRQYSMLRVDTLEEAEAAQRAGIDILSVAPSLLLNPQYRDAAPEVFTIPGGEDDELVTEEDHLRRGMKMMRNGADAIYCAASSSTLRRLRAEGIPVCGHSGLVPSRATWTGGFKAVGKTADQALLVWQQIQTLEADGVWAAEIEAVPAEVATLISQHTPLFMVSMGSGGGCDAQYLFGCDVLGTNRGFMPKHSKVYRNFAAEYDRLQAERVAAFKEFHGDVTSGAYPQPEHLQRVKPEEFGAFRERLQQLLESGGRA